MLKRNAAIFKFELYEAPVRGLGPGVGSGMAISPLMGAIDDSGTAVWQCVRIDRPMPLAERGELAKDRPHSG